MMSSTDSKNYYEILGVDKNASQDDIKRAFKKLSIKYHPDKHVNDSEEEQKKNEELFKNINEAYQVLGDSNKRFEYDNPVNSNIHSFYEAFFKNGSTSGSYGQRNVPKGKDIIVNVYISIADIFNKSNIEVKYKQNIRCGECDGKGGIGVKTCNTCHGSGVVTTTVRQENFVQMFTNTCSDCSGKGYTIDKVCDKCNGTGFETISKTIGVDCSVIDYRLQSGVYLINPTGGHESTDKMGPNGALFIRVHIDMMGYSIINNTLQKIVDIPYYDMILGTESKFELPSGKSINYTINPGSKNNSTISLKTRPINVELVLNTVFPYKDEDKKLLEKIKKLHTSI